MSEPLEYVDEFVNEMTDVDPLFFDKLTNQLIRPESHQDNSLMLTALMMFHFTRNVLCDLVASGERDRALAMIREADEAILKQRDRVLAEFNAT